MEQLKKKKVVKKEAKLAARVRAQRAKIMPKIFLRKFSLLFLEIEYNGNLQQCLISNKGKTHRKVFETQICARWAKIGPEIRNYHFLKFGLLVFLSIA